MQICRRDEAKTYTPRYAVKLRKNSRRTILLHEDCLESYNERHPVPDSPDLQWESNGVLQTSNDGARVKQIPIRLTLSANLHIDWQ